MTKRTTNSALSVFQPLVYAMVRSSTYIPRTAKAEFQLFWITQFLVSTNKLISCFFVSRSYTTQIYKGRHIRWNVRLDHRRLDIIAPGYFKQPWFVTLSNNFLKPHVNYTGRQLFALREHFPDCRSGTIIASFHSFGQSPRCLLYTSRCV